MQWKNYARENGYNIIFDKRKFIDTLHFYTAKGEKKDEQEYRILLNISEPTEKHPEIAEIISKYFYDDKNSKRYSILKFDRRSIKEIVCNSKAAKEVLKKEIKDIPIRIKK